MNGLRDQLIKIISEILDIKAEEIRDDTSTATISNWDSMNHLLIITEIEKQFNISIPLEDSIELTNFKDLLDYITKEREARGFNIPDKEYNDIEIQGKIDRILINRIKIKLNVRLLPQLKEFISRNYNPNYILKNNTFFNYFFINYLSEDFSFEVILLQDQIIGMLGRIPCKLKCFDKVFDGCFFANLMIEEAYQNKGLGPRLVIDAMNKYDIQMVLSYGVNLVFILQKLKWVEMPHLRRFVKILSVKQCSTLIEKELPEKEETNGIMNENTTIFSFKEVNQFNKNIIDFWEKIKKKYPITVERSLDYLNWRYVNHPLLNYKIFIITKNDEIQSYIILREESPPNFKIGRIIDFISTDEAEGYSLSRIVNYCKKNKFDLIDYFCTGRFHEKSLRSLEFKEANEEPLSSIPLLFNPISTRKKEINFAFKFRDENLIDDRIKDFNNWYLTKGDGDQDRPN